MNDQLLCALIQPKLEGLLTGQLPGTLAEPVNRHLHACVTCQSAFLSLAAQGIFQVQSAFRLRLDAGSWLAPEVPWSANTDQTQRQLQAAFEPEPHYVEAYAYEGQWPYLGNDYY